jgi:hypothetical protein
MDKVYQHSYCNISAVGGENSSQGLFRARRPESIGFMSVGVNLEGLEPGSGLSECIMTDAFLWWRNISKSPLNKRGWVFQERLLSPRILHFCHNEIFWECREHAACESYSEGLWSVHKLWPFTFVKSWETENGTMFEPGSEDSDVPWLHFWYRVVVESYSRMDLSVPSDKLIALSGIANYVMPRVCSRYVAGMWRERLEISLLWSVSHYYCTSTRPVLYRAPSWSWASIDGEIFCVNHDVQDCSIYVEDVVLNHASKDTTGAVTGGWLDMRGSLKPMKLLKKDHGCSLEWFMLIDNRVVDNAVERYPGMDASVNLDIEPIDRFAFENDNAEGRLFVMPAHEYPTRGGGTLICLVLRLVETGNATFERIGIVTAYKDHGKEQLLEDLCEAVKAQLPCLRYKNGLHTIRII